MNDLTFIQKLQQLQQLGDPIEIEFLPLNPDTVEVTIGTHSAENIPLELSPTVERLSWPDAWVLTGALVEYALERGHEAQADALLSAAKRGLHKLVDVRLEQLKAA